VFFFFLIFLVSFLLFIDKEEKTEHKIIQTEKENPLIIKLLETAHSYEKTPYKFGGTTFAGMDCSGLVYTSYKKLNITLARSSKNMFYEGKEVTLGKVKPGDLLFFDTDKFESKVNHVGMVTSIDEGVVYFIHSTESKGVIITSID